MSEESWSVTYDYIWTYAESKPVGHIAHYSDGSVERVFYEPKKVSLTAAWKITPGNISDDLYEDAAEQIAKEEDRRILADIEAKQKGEQIAKAALYGLKKLLTAPRELPRCECGAGAIGSPFHSDWCPAA